MSRGRYDAQIYTNDAEKLGERLSTEVSKWSAIEAQRSSGQDQGQGYAEEESRAEGLSQSAEVEQEQTQEHGMER